MFLCPGMIAYSIAVVFAGSSTVWFAGTMEPHLFSEVIIDILLLGCCTSIPFTLIM